MESRYSLAKITEIFHRMPMPRHLGLDQSTFLSSTHNAVHQSVRGTKRKCTILLTCHGKKSLAIWKSKTRRSGFSTIFLKRPNNHWITGKAMNVLCGLGTDSKIVLKKRKNFCLGLLIPNRDGDVTLKKVNQVASEVFFVINKSVISSLFELFK